MDSIDRDKCRTSMQKIVDLDFNVVGANYTISRDARREILHGFDRDRSGDDLERKEIAPGYWIARKKKFTCKMPEIKSRQQLQYCQSLEGGFPSSLLATSGVSSTSVPLALGSTASKTSEVAMAQAC